MYFFIFFNFKFFEKDVHIFWVFAVFFCCYFLVFFQKQDKKLGNKKCPIFTILTEEKLVKYFV
jgi:hypothetical protein